MAIVLDADVVIRGERGKFDLQTWLASLPQERFELAAITVTELWHGVKRAKGTERAARAILERGSGFFADHPLYGTDCV